MTDLGHQLKTAKQQLSNELMFVLRRWEAEHRIMVTSVDVLHATALGEPQQIVSVEPYFDLGDLR